MNGRMNRVEKTISNLETAVSEMTKEIKTLKHALDELEKNKLPTSSCKHKVPEDSLCDCDIQYMK